MLVEVERGWCEAGVGWTASIAHLATTLGMKDEREEGGRQVFSGDMRGQGLVGWSGDSRSWFSS